MAVAVAVQLSSGGKQHLVGDCPGVDVGYEFLTQLRAGAFSSQRCVPMPTT